MTPKQWFAVGVLASASFGAAAQPAPARPNPLDADATVPAVPYHSAFAAYQRTASAEQPSPDKVWRAPNDAVATPGAHSGHTMPEAGAAPAAPKAPPAEHSKHH